MGPTVKRVEKLGKVTVGQAVRQDCESLGHASVHLPGPGDREGRPGPIDADR
jgi:hypothetical protein